MGEPALKERVSDLEMAMMELAYQSMKTDMAIKDLVNQNKSFQWEMKAFKDEMKDFKDEMKEFKNEMKDFKDEMKEFKDEMKDFKDEMKEFKNEMKQFKTDSEADRKRMNKQWGDLANKMGTIVEDIVAPGMGGVAREYFQVEEFNYFAVRVRTVKTDGSSRREFDVVAETPEFIFVVETKATARTEYISDFIKLIPELPSWFPVIGEKTLIPVFASLHLSDENIRYLTRNNIMAMAMRDDGMDFYNPEVREYLLKQNS
ncbi:conserved hypothetical protein [Desulfamplus magnetovallimortis]|uniref:Uncharacterized protein n=1 Tax=Desulfamplus magnetovallimortis TaxID=1246637 RepID=A0A1W1HDY9_9BACT|nr:hypothetical protein [Desulfamplus magnetovallimortis]SLM30653.1 conserved hypothetical protein [Desulfamplus magnetovallimortis]